MEKVCNWIANETVIEGKSGPVCIERFTATNLTMIVSVGGYSLTRVLL